MQMQQQRQHFMGQEQDAGGIGSCFSENQSLSPHPVPSSAASNVPAGNGNVDRVLFKNLVEMVPLVESLMDRRASTSFTRRASVIYTRPPARESQAKKEAKGRKTPTLSAKKRGTDNDQSKNVRKDNRDSWTDDFSVSSLKKLPTEKDRSELAALQKQVEDLQKKLVEKDEILKSAEDAMNQANMVHVKLSELTRELAEKDSLIKSAQLQLSDAQMKLADKQASLEKFQWELMTSRSETEKLQENLDFVDREAGILLQAIDTFAKDSTIDDDRKGSSFDYLDHLPIIEQEEVGNEIEVQVMENARQSYIAAVAYAKENPSEESLALAAEARQRLRGFALGFNGKSFYVTK